MCTIQHNSCTDTDTRGHGPKETPLGPPVFVYGGHLYEFNFIRLVIFLLRFRVFFRALCIARYAHDPQTSVPPFDFCARATTPFWPGTRALKTGRRFGRGRKRRGGGSKGVEKLRRNIIKPCV